MADSERPTAFNSADPLRNFSISTEERIRAITIGVPAWAARKRKIEDDEVRLVRELVDLYDVLVKKRRTPTEIELALVSAATAFDLDKLNKLVVQHNKYYPIEANLPMDRNSNYLAYGKVWVAEEPYTAQRLVGLANQALAKRDE